MKISRLTFCGFYLNGALGSGKYDHLSVEWAKGAIRDGTILEKLKMELGTDIDLSILQPEEREELMAEWRDLADVDESRKFCVDRNGLCLLVAYLFEGIQRRCRESH